MENGEESVTVDILHRVNVAKRHICRFKQQIENKEIMVCLGNSRSGKSTLVNYIQGNELEAFEDHKRTYIKAKNSQDAGPVIGQGSVSYTELPTVWEIQNQPDTVIVDVPGFDDNRGFVHDIVNTLFLNQLKHSRSVRFVLVSDIGDVDNDNVGAFTTAMAKLQTIIDDFNELKDSVSVVFTKDWKNYRKEEIATLLKKKILNVPEMLVKKELIYHVIKNAQIIGIWKMPPEKGTVTGEIDDNIQAAIYNTHPILINTANIKFALPEQAHYVLLDVYQRYCVEMDFSKEVKKIVRRFSDYFSVDKYVFASTEEELGDTKSRLQYALPRITTEKCKVFTTLAPLKESLCTVAGTLCEDFEEKLNFFIFMDKWSLLDRNMKNIIIANYKNALSNLEDQINKLIAKIDAEVDDRITETIQYFLSEAVSDKTKIKLMGAACIPAATKALAALGIELPTCFTFEIVEFSAAGCGLAGAGVGGAAAGGYAVLYYKTIHLRKRLRQEQGRNNQTNSQMQVNSGSK